MTKDSQQLLAEYAANGSEAAFRELVVRYLGLVHSTALRLVGGNTQMAEDVSQTVFLGLARKGRTLSSKVKLGGWLHQHTYYAATRAIRNEQRRQVREQEAVQMNTLQDGTEAQWHQLAPILDDAITQLGSEDRTAIMLRYFEQQNFRAIGKALGSTQDAARVRVNRALEKLHFLLKQRGVVLSAATLGSLLTVQAVTIPPAGLAIAISTAAMAGATTGTGLTLTLLKLMASTKIKLALPALIAVGLTTTFVMHHRSQMNLREENRALREQIGHRETDHEKFSTRASTVGRTPRFPVPNAWAAARPSEPLSEDLHLPSLYTRLLKDGKSAVLTIEGVQPYLEANGRNAASLVAAFRATGDPTLLQEALQRYPNNPQVNFTAALNKDFPPEERRQWLDAFEKSDPENALANHLSALDYFDSGKRDQAVQELIAASGKQQFQDYTKDFVMNAEEAYLAAGYAAADAKTLSTTGLALPQLSELKRLGQDMVNLAASYRQVGDESSAQATLQIAANLGQGYRNASTQQLAAQLVGMSIEDMSLKAMNPTSAYGDTGQTVQDRISQLAQQRAALREITQKITPIMEMMSDQDWISFNNRLMIFGEEPAMRWLVSKHVTP